MPHEPLGSTDGDEFLGRLLRRAREPFASHIQLAGFPSAVVTIVRSARHLIEENPEIAGPIAASGVREEGTLWFVGEAAESVRSSLGFDLKAFPNPAAALIPARVFTVLAYGHPYFDGNKRTAFLAATLMGYYLGFETRLLPFSEIEEPVRDFAARNATETEVAGWLMGNVFIAPRQKEG